MTLSIRERNGNEMFFYIPSFQIPCGNPAKNRSSSLSLTCRKRRLNGAVLQVRPHKLKSPAQRPKAPNKARYFAAHNRQW